MVGLEIRVGIGDEINDSCDIMGWVVKDRISVMVRVG